MNAHYGVSADDGVHADGAGSTAPGAIGPVRVPLVRRIRAACNVRVARKVRVTRVARAAL
jgi:hypothetical protein